MNSISRRQASFAMICISFALAQTSVAADGEKLSPRYPLDVRDAPTAAVFAMMLDGSEVTVSHHFPEFVTLRLTSKQIALPPPDPGRGYGDYWPIAGWVGHLQKKMGVRGMILGFEREGGAFYVSVDGASNSSGYDHYWTSWVTPNESWHRVGPNAPKEPVPSPVEAVLSSFRLAGVRFNQDVNTRRAILVVRNKTDEAFTRVVREGQQVGIEGLKVDKIEPSKITLSRPNAEPLQLILKGSR